MGCPTGRRGGVNPQRNWKGAISPSMATGTAAKAIIMAVAGVTVRSPAGWGSFSSAGCGAVVGVSVAASAAPRPAGGALSGANAWLKKSSSGTA